MSTHRTAGFIPAVRYRLRAAPMQVAQQFLAAMARDWDGNLGALRNHLDG